MSMCVYLCDPGQWNFHRRLYYLSRAAAPIHSMHIQPRAFAASTPSSALSSPCPWLDDVCRLIFRSADHHVADAYARHCHHQQTPSSPLPSAQPLQPFVSAILTFVSRFSSLLSLDVTVCHSVSPVLVWCKKQQNTRKRESLRVLRRAFPS